MNLELFENQSEPVLNGGCILISRQILDSKLWSCNDVIFRVAIYLLLSANYKAKYFRRVQVERGQTCRSINRIAEDCNLSSKKVRNALDVLQKDGFITKDYPFGARYGQRLTICKYDTYQNIDFYKGKQPADKGQTDGNQGAPNNKEKKENKRKEYNMPQEAFQKISAIIEILNKEAGTDYRPTNVNTQKQISARLNEEFTVEDFKTVITFKTAEWLNNSQMRKYLRPETLFGMKFETYLNTAKLVKNELDVKNDFSL